MKILDLEQGSPEWLAARLGVATASNFNKIITSTGKLSASLKPYAMELASEYLLIGIEDGYKSASMLRGNELEPYAIDLYQEQTLSPVERVGFLSCGDYGYSPDGLIGKDGLIEVKCPEYKNHMKYMVNDKVPSEYIAQVQGGLFVSGRKWCDFVSFNPNFKKGHQLFIKRVFRDEAYIEAISEGIRQTIYSRDEFLKKVNGAFYEITKTSGRV